MIGQYASAERAFKRVQVLLQDGYWPGVILHADGSASLTYDPIPILRGVTIGEKMNVCETCNGIGIIPVAYYTTEDRPELVNENCPDCDSGIYGEGEKMIDYVTQEAIVCENCGEIEDLSIIQFVYGSKVICNTCGETVRS